MNQTRFAGRWESTSRSAPHTPAGTFPRLWVLPGHDAVAIGPVRDFQATYCGPLLQVSELVGDTVSDAERILADPSVGDPGRRVCFCNKKPPCRHHHWCKQAHGWQLEQPELGVMIWPTPGGRTYTTTPTEYPFESVGAS